MYCAFRAKKKRYIIRILTSVIHNTKAIDAEKKKYGWKAFVTDVSKKRLDFIDVIKYYRNQYRVERVFNRLKSRLKIACQRRCENVPNRAG